MKPEAKKAQKTLLILFGLILVFSLEQLFSYAYMSSGDEVTYRIVMRLVLSFGLMYAVYIGKAWAKMMFSVLLILGTFLSVYYIFTSEEALFTSKAIFMSLVYGYTVYFLNANDGVQEFLMYQKLNEDK